MPRHAKNNTAGSVFTYHERSQLGDYGTQTERLAGHSLKDFDACSLCLKVAIHPHSCPNGHIFCKECIFEYLLSSKRELERSMQEYAKQVAEDQNQQVAEEEQIRQYEIKKFEESEFGLLPSEVNAFRQVQGVSQPANTSLTRVGQVTSNPVDDNKAAPPEGFIAYENSQGQRMFVVDPSSSLEQKERIRKELQLYRQLNEREQKKQQTNFWLSTPDTQVAKKKAPRKFLTCPSCEPPKKLSLKKLVAVDFKPVKDRSVSGHRYMCPCCCKTLSNVMDLVLLKRCGHVVCQSCVDQFVKPQSTCVQCQKKLRIPKDLIKLQRGGSGFSAHNTVEASTYRTAFV